MRHFGSLLAGLVVAPLAWVLIAAGQPRTEQTFERWTASTGTIYTGDVLGPLGLVLGAGLLLGLIVALRLSPLGPLVAGAAYLAVYGWAVREPMWVVDTLPQFEINGYRVDTVPPFTNGTMALAGAVLVVAALSRRRWQRWPVAPPAAPAAGTAAGTAPEPVGVPVGVPAPVGVPESPAPAGAGVYSPSEMPAGAAVYTPNEVAAGPPPAVGTGPLWPSTVDTSSVSQTLTRESMYAGLTPGTAEDLPRRSPPKRPAGSEPDGPPPAHAAPDDPTVGHGPPPAPLIPSPRHAAAAEGWPLDSWPATNPADRPTIQPTFQVPPETPSSELTQPVQPRPEPEPEPPADTTQTQPTVAQNEEPQAQTPEPPSAEAPPMRPVNPLAQRPVSPPPAGPPRPRPVNPLSPRPQATPPDDASDATQQLPGQPGPATGPATGDAEGDATGDPAEPPASSPWSRPPRPPQES